MPHAPRIVRKFGGTRPMAAALGIPPSTVQAWKTSGYIPSPRLQEVLDKARELRLGITPYDFFDDDQPTGCL